MSLCPTCGLEVPRVTGHAQGGIRRAASSGHVILVEPRPNELQIDLDGERALHRFAAQWQLLTKYGLTAGWKQRLKPSHTAGHIHVTITLPKDIGDLERVMYQAVLGSDLTREAFDLVRVKKGNKYPIVFFEKAAPPRLPK